MRATDVFRQVFDKNAFIIFLISKCLVVFSAVSFYFIFDNTEFLWFRHYVEPVLEILTPFANWDGQHYLAIADWGYEYKPASQAFFPLYPALIYLATQVFADYHVAAFILNCILSYLFILCYLKYSLHYLDRNKAILSTIAVLCFPSAFFMSMFYSEALFMLLVFSFLYFYEVKKSYKSIFFAILIPLARGQALFIGAAIFLYFLFKVLSKKEINVKYEIVNLASFAVGGFIYLGIMYSYTGSAFAGLEAQELFTFKNSFSNIFSLTHFLEYMLTPPERFFSGVNSILDKVFIVTFFGLFWLVIKTKNMLWIFMYVLIIYPVASMGEGGSFVRFSLLAFPIITLSFLSLFPNQVKVLYLAIMVSACMQLYFIYRFSLNMWVA